MQPETISLLYLRQPGEDNHADKSKLQDADLAKEMTALDEVASKLYRADVGRNYQPGRIYEISHIVAAPTD
jgi:hypothetical protein